MDAKCIEVLYVEGRFGRIRASEKERCVRDGWVIQRKSRSIPDCYDAVYPSHLVLVMELDGQPRRVRVDMFFKARIGRLSERRRRAIMETMPETVSVAGRYGRQGSYLAVSQGDLARWADRAEDLLGPRRRRK